MVMLDSMIFKSIYNKGLEKRKCIKIRNMGIAIVVEIV